MIDQKKQEKQLVAIEVARQYIEKGEEIPMEISKVLFPPEKRECELQYFGKQSKEEILSKITPVPFQEDKLFPFGTSIDKDKWINKLIFGENSQILKTLIQMKKDGKLKNSDETNGVRLIYIDPPFATKQEFKVSGSDQIAYTDKLSSAEFIEFLRKRLILAYELLADNGSIFVHLDWKMSHYIKVIMDEIFGKNNFRNEIVWAYTGPGSPGMKQFNRKHDVILWYTKTQDWIFNGDNIRIESNVHVGGFNNEMGKEDSQKYTLQGKIPEDWWNIAVAARRKVDGFNRTGYPTEKPQQLLERIIKATTNAGDLVLDFFAGSGITAFVAEKINRRWIAIDVGKYSIYTIQKRLLKIPKVKPFMLYSAGLYDPEKLNKFDSKNWKLFALQLWGCTSESRTIKGIEFEGLKDNCLVKVYSPQELKEKSSKISFETLTEIDNIIGKHAGFELFIIAPQGQFDFAEDDVEIKDRVFHILRVPYSLLAKFTENFTPIMQPHNSDEINEIVDSVGFDFIQPPFVDFKIENDKLIIKQFKSNSRLKGEQNKELSMILIDYDYNDKVFDLDEIIYNNEIYEIEKSSACKSFKEIKMKKPKGKTMLIFVDNSGNEKKVVING